MGSDLSCGKCVTLKSVAAKVTQQEIDLHHVPAWPP